jgi:acetyl esterase
MVPLSEAARALIDMMNERTPKVGTDVLDARAAREMQRAGTTGGAGIPLARVRDLPGAAGPDSPPVTIRLYEPDITPTDRPLIVFVHGGGWVLCDLDTHDPMCRRLARGTGAVVASIDFRRAPEHPFPAPLDDVYASLAWLHDNAAGLGVDPRRIGIAGDSSGGNLAGAATLLARDRGGPRLLFQALLYPVTDHRLDTRSYRDFGDSGGFLTRAKMEWYWSQYLGEQERGNPLVSLVDADIRGLPRTLIIVAECDPLRDEGAKYAERLRQQGNDVSLVSYDGAFHGFLSLGDVLDVADRAETETHSWIKQILTKKRGQIVSTQANRELVLSILPTLVAHDAITDDFEFAIQADPSSHAAAGRVLDGAALVAGLAATRQTFRFPDGGPAGDGLRQTVRSITAEEDRVVVETVAEGILKSDPSRALKNRGVFVYEFRGDKVARLRVYEDTGYVTAFWAGENSAITQAVDAS